MTYPPSNSGYPVPQQPGFGAPGAPSYPAGPSRLPVYLTVAVAALGLAAYLASFGPLLSINTDIGPFGGAEFTASGLSYWTVAALVGALLAAASLLPRVVKSADYLPVIAVSSVLGVLLVIAQIINRPAGFSIGWALWLVLLFTVLQAAAAVTALLFSTGVLRPPAPRPRYGQHYTQAQHAGQYGGQYGPPGYYPSLPSQGAQPGYPPPYGAYPPGSAGPGESTDTPPTGIPSHSPSPSAPESSPGATSGPSPS